MVDFRDVISNLVEIGFYDIFLPFILVYAVVFAILQKSRIFEGKGGEANEARNINAVVALVFGIFVVASVQTVKIIQSIIINVVVFIVFILVAMIVLGFIFGRDWYKNLFGEDGSNKGLIYTVAAVVVLVPLILLSVTLGFWEWLENAFSFDIDGGEIGAWIVLILIIAVVVWISRSGGSDSKSGGSGGDSDN